MHENYTALTSQNIMANPSKDSACLLYANKTDHVKYELYWICHETS